MSTTARILSGIAMILALFYADIALVRAGLYGWTLFVALPLGVGAVGAWVMPHRTPGEALSGATLATVFACGSLFLLGAEGAICIVMALPLVIPLGMVGGLAFYFLRHGLGARGFAALLMIPSASLAYDSTATPPVYEVRSSIEINAPVSEVWKHVIEFPELAKPDEWYFRAGVAFPKRAHIEGTGPGAIRYCEFSTGSFTEPIEVWDEPHLLRFSVTESPSPMREWSPYADVEPVHLHGYLISREGQFHLTELRDGRTLLEGTTWYQHGLWPAQYWRLWSDAIIHRIHLRVLRHIRDLSEGQG